MAETKKPVRLDAYIRVSREGKRKGPNYIAKKMQRDAIAGWVAQRPHVEIVEWFEEVNQSGKKFDRPVLNEVIRRVRSNITDGVVVSKLDRFGRSLVGSLEAIQQIDDAGGKVNSVEDDVDATTPAGKLHQSFMLILAEFELDRIRGSWKTSRKEAVARGVHIASRTPTGYRRSADGTLEPDPSAAPHIAEVFRKRAAGASWRALANHLDDHGVQGPYKAPRWTPRAVQHLITNRVYLGEARSGEFVNGAAHAAIVDVGDWHAAQGARGSSAPRSREPALLAGLLRCAGCRYLMKPDRMTLRSGERVRTYRCRGDHAQGVCDDRSAVLGSVIEPWAEAHFFEIAGEVAARAEEPSADLDAAIARVQAAESAVTTFRDDDRLLETLGADLYVEGLQKKVESLRVAQAELSRIETGRGAALVADATTLSAVWPSLPTADKQALMRTVIDCIFLRTGRKLAIDQRALVLPRGSAPDDLPRRGKRVPLRRFDWPNDLP